MGLVSNISIEFVASFLIWILYFGLGILWFIDGKIKKEQVVHALLASFIAWSIAFLIKTFFPTLRPFEINGGPVGVLITPTDSAFPSAHSALAFALAVTIFMHDNKIGWLFLFWAFLIGTARVLANVHFPIDILGGAFIGTITAVVVEKIHFFKLIPKK